MRPLLLAVTLPLFALSAPAADKKGGVKSVEATFEPAEAKPGQTVTFKLTVTLEDGYYTYPLVQPEKGGAEYQVNKLEFPKADAVVFVGEPLDPPNPKTKADPAASITEMHYFTGTVVYQRTAVVAPAAKPGEVTVQLPKFSLSVCDKDACYPAKTHKPEAKLKVVEGSVPVDKKYAAEVEKAVQGK